MVTPPAAVVVMAPAGLGDEAERVRRGCIEMSAGEGRSLPGSAAKTRERSCGGKR